MEVDYQVEGPLDLPKTMEKQIYRIAIEALNNSLKHAVASRIRVHLRVDSDLVSLEITDNGQGFDTNQVHGGMGLGNMRDRAESLGGWLKVWSATGEGTQVLLSVAR
jgi:signal transduction histidine kinase